MKKKSKCLIGFILAILAAANAFAATGSITGTLVSRVWHYTDTTRGPGGRAYVTVTSRFNTVGGCLYGGGIDAPQNWFLEFHVEHGSFKAMYAQALLAYANKSMVTIYYDDGFGSGTSCRITGFILD
jgi:hypothetical protein